MIPHSALVGEVFGTAGEEHTLPQYRGGVRWESSKLITALTCGRGFDGAGGPRWELGAMYLTDPMLAFCWGRSPCGK